MCVCNSECGQSIISHRPQAYSKFCTYQITRLRNGDEYYFFLPERYGSQSGSLPSSNLTGAIFSLRELWLPCSRVLIFTAVYACVWGGGGGDFSRELSLNVYCRLVVHIKLQVILKKNIV